MRASSRAGSTHSYGISRLSWSLGAFHGNEAALLTLISGDRVCFYASDLKRVESDAEQEPFRKRTGDTETQREKPLFATSL